MKYKRLLLAILLLTSGVVAQSVYVPPTIPPLFTATDLLNSASLYQTIQTAYATTTALTVQHDRDLYAPTGTVGTLKTSLNNLTVAVNAMTKAQITIPLNTCAAIPPAVLNLNQVAQPTTTYGNFGGWKMMWISLPTHEAVSCPVNVTTQGYYYVVGAFISQTNGNMMHVETPGGVNVSGEILVPNTGSWISVFAQARSPLPIALPAGPSTLVLNFESGGFDAGGFALVQQ